jgi:hypothetical protein
MVGHEEGVEFAAFQGPRVMDQMVEIEVRIRCPARVAPGRGVDADRTHEGAEAKLFFGGCHGWIFLFGQGTV